MPKPIIIDEYINAVPEQTKVALYQMRSMLKEIAPNETEQFNLLTLEESIENLYNRTINRVYSVPIRKKSAIWDNLAKKFPSVRFEECDPELDHAGDIDYLGRVGDKAFGIQIKPVTAKSNFGNYSVSERMRKSFEEFTEEYGGSVFLVFSVDDKIKNENVLIQIEQEIKRLTE